MCVCFFETKKQQQEETKNIKRDGDAGEVARGRGKGNVCGRRGQGQGQRGGLQAKTNTSCHTTMRGIPGAARGGGGGGGRGQDAGQMRELPTDISSSSPACPARPSRFRSTHAISPLLSTSTTWRSLATPCVTCCPAGTAQSVRSASPRATRRYLFVVVVCLLLLFCCCCRTRTHVDATRARFLLS
jgi:hypothetical protein